MANSTKPEIPVKGLEVWACEWEDAHFNSDEFERGDITHRPINYITVGILLANDDVGMSFSSDVCETGTFRGTNFIPRKMIVRAWKTGSLRKRKSSGSPHGNATTPSSLANERKRSSADNQPDG